MKRRTILAIIFLFGSLITSSTVKAVVSCEGLFEFSSRRVNSPAVIALIQRGFEIEVAKKFASSNPELVARLLADPEMRPITVYRGLSRISKNEFNPMYRAHYFGTAPYQVNTSTSKMDALSYAAWYGKGVLIKLQIPSRGISELSSGDTFEFGEFRNSNIDYVIDSRNLLNQDISPFILNMWEVDDEKPAEAGYRKVFDRDAVASYWTRVNRK